MSGYFARLAQRSGLAGRNQPTPRAAGAMPQEVDEVKEAAPTYAPSNPSVTEMPGAETRAAGEQASTASTRDTANVPGEPVARDATEIPMREKPPVEPDDAAIQPSVPDAQDRPVGPTLRVDAQDVQTLTETPFATPPATDMEADMPTPGARVRASEASVADSDTSSGFRAHDEAPAVIRESSRQTLMHELQDIASTASSEAPAEVQDQPSSLQGSPQLSVSMSEPQSVPRDFDVPMPTAVGQRREKAQDDAVAIHIGRVNLEVHAPAAPALQVTPPAPAPPPSPSRPARAAPATGLRRLYVREF